MRIIDVEQKTPEWLEMRRGKVTGSTLKDLVVLRGNGKKMGYYELIAQKVAISPDDENAMDRGHRLEQVAVDAFQLATGLTVDRTVGFAVRDDNQDIAISPDGLIRDDKGIFTAGVEIKCLSSARHIQNIIEDVIPSDYLPQILQYFIVLDTIDTVYFVSYDDRVPSRPLHIIEASRDDFEVEISKYHDYQETALESINDWATRLAF